MHEPFVWNLLFSLLFILRFPQTGLDELEDTLLRQCIKIVFLVMYKDMEWSRKVLRFGIWEFWPCVTIFCTVRFFRKKKFLEFLAHPLPYAFGSLLPGRIITTPAAVRWRSLIFYYACGYFITRAVWCYVKRLCNSLEKLIRMYEKAQKQNINCTITYKFHMQILIKESIWTSWTPVFSSCRNWRNEKLHVLYKSRIHLGETDFFPESKTNFHEKEWFIRYCFKIGSDIQYCKALGSWFRNVQK